MGAIQVRLEMELEDIPGQLVRALEPISRFGGNIKSVVHRRERKTQLGMVPVTVVLEVGEKERFNRILSELKSMGVRITHVGEREEMKKRVVLISGPLTIEELDEITKRVGELKGTKISDVSLAMESVGGGMAARLTISGRSDRSLDSAFSLIESIAEKKRFLLMKSVEEGG